MGMLLLDLTAVEKTWASIEARISRRPVFQVVPNAALVTIENVIMAGEDEAWDRWPGQNLGDDDLPDVEKNHADQRCRIHFAKEALLDAVPTESRGLMAVYFHEYIASTLRGADATADEDIVYSRISISPAVAQRALAEAYETCSAGLEGYRVTWNE